MTFSEEDWAAYGARQKLFEVHSATSTIPLLYDEDFRHANPSAWPHFEPLRNDIEPILTSVRRHYNKSLAARRLQERNGQAYPARIILTRLNPGGVIPPHIDTGYSLTHSHRIHLPVISSENVEFSVDGVAKQLEAGTLWEINNRREHAVNNRGGAARTHLILDWVIPGERCCCSVKASPQGKCSQVLCNETDTRIEPCSCLR